MWLHALFPAIHHCLFFSSTCCFFRDLFQLIPPSYWTRAHYALPLQYCPMANPPVWMSSVLSREREIELIFVQHCFCLNVSKEDCCSSYCLFVCLFVLRGSHRPICCPRFESTLARSFICKQLNIMCSCPKAHRNDMVDIHLFFKWPETWTILSL